jgi:ferredoxin
MVRVEGVGKVTSQNYSELTSILQAEAKRILESPDVKRVLGWKKGSYGLRISPAFIEDATCISDLIWSPFCINNLSVYPTLEENLPLPRGMDEDVRKTAIMVKGCDSRGLVQMFVENGYPRDRLMILGMPCTGQIDINKLMPKLEENGINEEIDLSELDVIDKSESYRLTINGKVIEIPKLEIIYEKCLKCKYPNPIIYDKLLADPVESRGKAGEGYEKVDELDSLQDSERWAYWSEKFDRCIRCYACRNICPVCYCKECLTDKWEPDWINKSVNLTENTMFHITRAFHLVGRCISCHECERACPVGIPLLDLYEKLGKEVLKLFDYEPGTDPEAKSLLTTFNPDDPGEFIL